MRAPYKNKLARLNILNRRNKFILSIKFLNSHQVVGDTNQYLNCIYPSNDSILFMEFLLLCDKIHFSFIKSKHTKTTVSLPVKIVHNFFLKNHL